MKYSSVVITGSIAHDDIMDFPEKFVDYFLPEKLHQINISFVVHKLTKQLGGTGLNITYNLKKTTNNNRIILLGAVGRDGQIFLDFCQKNNINTTGIINDDRLYSASGKVITDKNNNQIWGYYYGASELAKKIDLSKFGDKESLVVISANHPDSFLHFQRQAIEIGCHYLYDPGMTLTWIKKEDLKFGVRNCHWLIGNDYEIARILKIINTNIDKLNENGVIVITTLGDKGVCYQEKNHTYSIKCFNKIKLVDPTGAGDAWRGGFIGGLLNGEGIENSLKLGNVMASFAIEKYGTINHQPTKNEINERLKQLSN